MKRGCFFSGIIFLTITIGVAFYLYKTYSHEIKNFGKEKIIQVALDEINDKIDKISDSPYNDSVKTLLSKNAEFNKEGNFEETMNRFGIFIEQVDYFIKDNSLDSVEFTKLKTMAME